MIFESHAHYDDARFDPDRDALIRSLQAGGVGAVVNVGADMDSTAHSVRLASQYDFFYAAVGVHPHAACQMTDENLEHLAALCQNPRVVAVGEIGLDFYYDHSPRDVQAHWFREQLKLAERVGLPVIIHSRDAAAQTMDIIKASGVRRGVIHCYAGSPEMALEYISLGFYIGVGGVVTFDKTKRLTKTIESLPLDRLLVETDCPYLAPVPFRGKRNHSLYLCHIINKIADIRGCSPQTVEDATCQNAKTLFGVD